VTTEVQICSVIVPFWSAETTVSEILRDINQSIEAAWLSFGWVTPSVFVVEMTLANYKHIEGRNALPALTIFPGLHHAMSVLRYASINNIASSMGTGFRIVITPESI
jgi:hypothetical protein